jgi:hypothetical protein
VNRHVRFLMKVILGIIVAVLLAVILLVYIAKPDIPKVSGIPDYELGVGCLREIPTKYNPDLFTFEAWIKSWYAHQASKWGIDISPSLLIFYQRYIDLQLDVGCYIQSSNDPCLNMALSSIEFVAIYNVIAENHGLKKIQ